MGAGAQDTWTPALAGWTGSRGTCSCCPARSGRIMHHTHGDNVEAGSAALFWCRCSNTWERPHHAHLPTNILQQGGATSTHLRLLCGEGQVIQYALCCDARGTWYA